MTGPGRIVWVPLAALAALAVAVAPAAAQDMATQRSIPIQSAGFHVRSSPDGTMAAVFENAILLDHVVDSEHLPIRLIDLASGTPVGSLDGFTDYAADVAFAPDGSRAASVHWNGELSLWDLSTDPATRSSLPSGTIGGSRIAFGPDSRTLLVQNGAAPQRFLLFDVETGAISHIMGRSFPTYEGLVEEHMRGAPFDVSYAAFALSPDGSTLATATLNDEVALWRIPDGQPVTLRPKSERVGGVNIRRLTFTPDGTSLLYFDGSDGQTHVWDVPSRSERLVLPFGGTAFAVLPDGRRIVWAEPRAEDLTLVRMAELSNGSEPLDIATISARSTPETTVTSGPDGARLVVGGFAVPEEENQLVVIELE